uniref:50S ribosomal protein L19, chloroplastic n=2 Tax=Ecklonia TaxID=105406 RepID=A0A8F0FA14_9PHAE|nr:50S ribosomal protein L19 [Ecklonia radiata]YP_011006339.1 50S ribosomal protein L19 [Ecklonia cava]YP_011006480.1 50S ribosomal protein L19 [Eisenia bicyclis]QWK43234.1 ribosomal protein L19 [Ecklonia arborea]QWK43518.1 ribosomal protein L19 [Ecklonia radicosa]WAM63484.1 50S ribosomal protein L19 [Ecklonia cava subsp. stolonifera]WAM63343.1 50S ribosomal protein L19 [Ecklonia cava]WAM63625.1 50S ribosomal protein L19 [Eisenia bicyclis]
MKNIKQATFLNDKELIDSVESVHIKKNLSKIFVGDTVKIGIFIKEGNKERIQYYQGIILGKNNSGINLTISVRKVFQGIGVERNFLIHSPKFESIEVIKSSRVRRSKLYYLRSIVGKGSRLKQRFRTK